MDQLPPIRAKASTTPHEDRAMRNVRALVERNRLDSGLDRAGDAPRAIRTVGIVGAGLMGASIAAAEINKGLPVVITDADPKALDGCAQRIAAALHCAGDSDAEAQEQVARLVTTTGDLAEVALCDLVLESIVENYQAKAQVFSQLENDLGENTLLASNTSTIPIGRLASGLKDRARFCGIHFCHPVHERPLVEIVRGPKTSDLSIAAAVAHAKAIGRMPIVVQDGPGFLVNRLLLPFLSEAMELLLEGVSVQQVEQAALKFGWAKGPLGLLDEIGLKTTLQGGWILSEAFPDRITASPLLVAMVKAGRTGREVGAGFFTYHPSSHMHNGMNGQNGQNGHNGFGGPAHAGDDHLAGSEEDLQNIIAQWARPRQEHTPHSVTIRLLLPMVLEATRILEENKARDARDIDMAVLFGLGFPQSHGGLLWWSDTLGAARIIEMLRPLHRLGPRAQPTQMLRELARRGGHFYNA
jgi:3-hydroxyacyl-CoA dehydrogenase